MKTVKQSKYNTCIHCVCAMLTNTDEKYVIDWFSNYGPDMSLCVEDAILFLAHHGIYLAANVKNDYKDMGADYVAIVSFDGFELFVCVESEGFPGRRHVIYWDGKKVHDPNPGTQRTTLDEYEINYIYPITRAKNRE